ncbi:MAG: nitronate monooxygenase, partial [Hydrogenophaga sp.]|nr:nitronate monooxygenase [Hydrogenophaga sp.]
MDKSSAIEVGADTAEWQQLLSLCRASGLRPLRLAGRELLPVVQGGMGVGVSASRLAGQVARLGAMGTISAVDLRRLHPDLMAQTAHLNKESDAKDRINAANLVALDREIRAARATAEGHGLLAVNVMRALSAYDAYVRQALESGIDALVVGAGLPPAPRPDGTNR